MAVAVGMPIRGVHAAPDNAGWLTSRMTRSAAPARLPAACAYPGTGAGTPHAAGLPFVILMTFLIAAGRLPVKGTRACYQALMISGRLRAREPVVTAWGLRDD